VSFHRCFELAITANQPRNSRNSNFVVLLPVAMVWTDQDFKDIREEIDVAMEQANDSKTRFITPHKLLEIWTQARLESFCHMVEPLSTEPEVVLTVCRIRQDLLRTLSILVSIVWDGWQRFPQIFFDTRYSKPGERVDRTIKTCEKATLEHASFLGKPFWAQWFLRHRNAFFPITIKYRKIQVYKSGRRLPFVLPRNEVEVLGSGASGTVTKERIAYLQYKLDGIHQPVRICFSLSTKLINNRLTRSKKM
jgi:hypothetical protein